MGLDFKGEEDVLKWKVSKVNSSQIGPDQGPSEDSVWGCLSPCGWAERSSNWNVLGTKGGREKGTDQK